MALNLQARITLTDKFSRPMRNATKQMQRAQKVSNSLTRNVAKLSGAITALAGGASLAIVSRNVVQMGMAFDTSMSRVQAVTQATGDQLRILEDTAKRMGETTVFTAGQAADAMSYLGMAGFNTAQIIGSIEGVMDLAAAGQLNLARAADIASNVMSGFNKSAEDMGHISDVLAKAAASANTNVEQMGYAMSYVAPIANGLGISMEETAAAIGILSNAGIQGTRAGTALRGIFGQLSVVTGMTADKLEELGLSAADVNPNVHSLAEIVETLKNAGATAADAMQLVGQEAGPALAAMLTAGDDQIRKMTESFVNADGAAKEMAETMTDNLGGSFAEMRSAAEGFGLRIYNKIEQPLRNAVDGTRDFFKILSAGIAIMSGNRVEGIEGLTEVYGALDGGTEKVLNAVAFFENLREKLITVKNAFMTVYDSAKTAGRWIIDNWPQVKPVVLSIAAGMITLKASLKGLAVYKSITHMIDLYKKSTFAATVAQKGFNAALRANPAGLIITAITALVTAGVYLWQNWDTIKEKAQALWQKIKGVWDNIKDKTSRVWYDVKVFVVDAINGIIDKINWLIEKINKIPGVKVPIIPKVEAPKMPESMQQSSGMTPLAANGPVPGNYHGLDYVPRDNYLTRLHKGEAVLPRKEAENYRKGGGGQQTVIIRGNNFYIREEADIDKVVSGIVRKIEGKAATMAL